MTLCAADLIARDKPEDLPLLNHYTNSSLDFGKVQWRAEREGDMLTVIARYQEGTLVVLGTDTMHMAAWPYLTAATRRVVMQALILTAAANLVAQWRIHNPQGVLR